MELEWGPPPEEAFQRTSSGLYQQMASALREKPKEWAKVPRKFASVNSAQSAAGNIRRGRVQGMVFGQYEAVTAGEEVWVRYVGPTNGDGPRAVPRDDDHGDDGSADADARKAYPAKVRAWAKLQGDTISKHGRLPESLIVRYEAATGDTRPEGL